MFLVTGQLTSWNTGLPGSSMQEAGFQATNAFTGENPPHLTENFISSLSR